MDPHYETVTTDDDSSFRCMHFTCRSFAEDHTWHYHPEFELTWIMRSSGTRFIGDSVQPYAAGDLVLTGPNLPHCWHNDVVEGDPSTEAELIVLQFRPDLLNNTLLGLPEAASIRALFRRAQSGLAVGGKTVDAVGSLLQSMVLASGVQRLILLLQILDTLARSHELQALASIDYHLNNDINESNRRRIEMLHKYIHENIGNDISQTEVAAMVKMSPPAFSRFFKQATGMTFVSFVNLVRINEACRLLRHEHVNITQVAYRCGYNNISNFNRQFILAKGINPTEFRRLQRKLG